MSQRNNIEAGLRRLLTRSGGDSFIIVAHQPSGKFVQFVGSLTEPLTLDLPRQTLNSAELERAAILFRGLGAKLEEWPVLDRPGGGITGTQSGFQVKLGRDTGKATELALRVFSDVYLLPPEFPLSIHEN